MSEIQATLLARADEFDLVPRQDQLEAIFENIYALSGHGGHMDAQSAPIWAEKMRHTYAKVLETIYPEYAAANGEVAEIDTEIDPASTEAEYFRVDQTGFADWIDDDGHMIPGGSMTAKRYTLRHAEIGHEYKVNFFDLERAQKAKLALQPLKAKNAKRTHDAKTNWVWLMGDSAKALPGFLTHPNIPRVLAPLNAGTSSRLWANKTNAEILADLALVIDQVPVQTIRAFYAAIVYMPLQLMQICKNRQVGGDTNNYGSKNLWEYIKEQYSGDDTGQGKIEFRILNECSAAFRSNPVTQTDDSGLSGDCIMVCPPRDRDVWAFLRSRPFSTRPPQQIKFSMVHTTHSKIGGCKVTQPMAFVRLEFGTT